MAYDKIKRATKGDQFSRKSDPQNTQKNDRQKKADRRRSKRKRDNYYDDDDDE